MSNSLLCCANLVAGFLMFSQMVIVDAKECCSVVCVDGTNNQNCNNLSFPAEVFTKEKETIRDLKKTIEGLKQKTFRKGVFPSYNINTLNTYFASDGKFTYEAAETYCFARGGRLIAAGLRNRTEWSHMQSWRPNDTWVGLSDRLVEGTYKWSDGVPYAGSVGYRTGATAAADCAFAITTPGTNLTIFDCTNTKRALCEIAVVS